MPRIGHPHRAVRSRALPRHGAGRAHPRAGLCRLILAAGIAALPLGSAAAVPARSAHAAAAATPAAAVARTPGTAGAVAGNGIATESAPGTFVVVAESGNGTASAAGPGAAAAAPASSASGGAVPAPASGNGAAPAGAVDCSRPLSLGLHEHGLLYSSQTGEGIDKDIADELIRRSGCRIKLVVMPRARIWQLLESGTLDFSLSAIANDVRDRFAAFAWYMSNKYYLLVRRDANVRSVEDFRHHAELKVGAVRSFRYGPLANRFVDLLDDEQRVTYASALEPLYGILIENHIQGMIIEPVDYPAIEASQLRALTNILEFDDPPVLHGLVMSRKSISPAQQQAWRELMMSMRADGTVRRIFEKYLPADLARTMTQF
jgi:polar amino acid transport system substrate-binding protein